MPVVDVTAEADEAAANHQETYGRRPLFGDNRLRIKGRLPMPGRRLLERAGFIITTIGDQVRLSGEFSQGVRVEISEERRGA